ncbi:ATP-binding protein [Streptococcus sanguinis]|uniref:Helicase HerA central domain-containing protein n=1 Tax=Streptococcus sanguinis SK355 TaxID=888816 RepID=F3UTZ1_STRSA|nr:ATP-binding protein [Streptococcus sanguinis]EGJ36083.1 hypothetical protein HMPREF9389_2299 [Streptococcus sanguinis SK355]
MDNLNAQVISVKPNKIKIEVKSITDFQIAEEKLKIGSYLRIADENDLALIATIENFCIEPIEIDEKVDIKYIIEAVPLGMIDEENKFVRGSDTITIPPKSVEPAKFEEIKLIFENSIKDELKFKFSSLSSNNDIEIPVEGNKFFNKHIAIVGSTGSGKSHTVAKVVQNAIHSKNGGYEGLNNSHILIFDIHNEYQSAFPNARLINVDNLILPYWLLNSDELQELFLDTEGSDHNQRNIFKKSVIKSKKSKFSGSEEEKEKLHFDSPIYFDIREVLQYAHEKNEEQIAGAREGQKKAGPLNGKLSNYISRLESKIYDKRLEFLLGGRIEEETLQSVLKQLIGYSEDSLTNVTILDLSGVPFDVLSITVSLISRIMFEYGYYYKQFNNSKNLVSDVPILLVYEEAHKYVPTSSLTKYRASRQSIERIAKEGRKYGVTLLLASQRPSEISETIFSQCSNFITMRLTNPIDQSYVRQLLPDSMGGIVDKLPSLATGEALLIGEATILPSIVKIDVCKDKPSSKDVPYFQLWKEKWKDINFEELEKLWKQK